MLVRVNRGFQNRSALEQTCPGWIRSAAGDGSSMVALTDGIARAFGRHT